MFRRCRNQLHAFWIIASGICILKLCAFRSEMYEKTPTKRRRTLDGNVHFNDEEEDWESNSSDATQGPGSVSVLLACFQPALEKIGTRKSDFLYATDMPFGDHVLHILLLKSANNTQRMD